MLRDRFMAFTQSRSFTVFMAVIGFLFIGGVFFFAGMDVGYRRAEFSTRAGQTYVREFGMPGHNAFFVAAGAPGAHGAFGKVVSYNGSTLVISSDQKPEQQITIATDTVVRQGPDTVATDTLAAGSYVVVFGVPNADGSVNAKLIRIVPDPATAPAP